MSDYICNAVILAAGHSIRMGSDKALLELEGRPLWRRQCDLLVAAGAREIFFSVRPDQLWAPMAFAHLRDPEPELGPLGGIEAGLARCQFAHLIVLAVDLAQITPVWFYRLQAILAPGCGAVGRWPDGVFEPLAAIYPKELVAEVRAARALRDYSLQKILSRAVSDGKLAVVELQESDRALFVNWNSPDDLRAR